MAARQLAGRLGDQLTNNGRSPVKIMSDPNGWREAGPPMAWLPAVANSAATHQQLLRQTKYLRRLASRDNRANMDWSSEFV